MTNEEFCNLQSQMQTGCLSERRDIIELMTPYRLSLFVQRLHLPANYPALNERTWSYAANVLAIHLEQALFKLGHAEQEISLGDSDPGRDCAGDHSSSARNGIPSQKNPPVAGLDEECGEIPRLAGSYC